MRELTQARIPRSTFRQPEMRKAFAAIREENSELVALKAFVRELKAENSRLQKQLAKEKARRVTAENRARVFEKYEREGPEGLTDAELDEIIKAGRKPTPEA